MSWRPCFYFMFIIIVHKDVRTLAVVQVVVSSLQSILPETPSSRPEGEKQTEHCPLHLTKWQPLTMMTICFDTGQIPKTLCPPVTSCWSTTPVQLQRAVNKVRTRRREGMYDGKEQVWGVTSEKEKTKHQVPLIFSYIMADIGDSMWGSHVNNAAWYSFRSHTEGGYDSSSHGRFLCCAPPLAVISFYNQHMQIRGWQPISQILATVYWEAGHVHVDMSWSQFVFRHSETCWEHFILICT